MDRVVDACRRAHAWRSSHQFLGRYSVDKLQQFDQYQRQTSFARSIGVISLSVAVTLTVLVVLFAIDTSDHDDGIVVSVQSALGHAIVGGAMALSSRQALCIPASESSLFVSLSVGAFVGVGSELVRHLLIEIWQTTPVPMGKMFVGAAMAALLFSWSYALMRRSLRRRWAKARAYAVVFAMQVTVVSAFVLVTLAFESATYVGQLLLILVHSALRVVATKLVWLQARKLNDLTTDVTICFAEMAGALCQTACLQRVRGPELGALLVMMDLTLVSLDMYVYATREYVVDGASTLRTSAKIIEGALDALCGPDAVEEEPGETKEDQASITSSRRRSYVTHATPSGGAISRSSASTTTTTPRMPWTSPNTSDGGPLFRKSGVVVLTEVQAVLTPPTERVASAKMRRTASDSHSGDATKDCDVVKKGVRRGSKTGRLQLTPSERRAAWKNASASPSRRRGVGGSTNSIVVSSSTITISTTTSTFRVVGTDTSAPQYSGALDPNREATTTESKVEEVTSVRPSKSQRKSTAHAVIYSAPSAEATATATPTAPSTASATSPGEPVGSRSRRRASSVFLTPRLFQDHGSKRLMNLSAVPNTARQVVRPAQASRPSQVKIDGLAVMRKDQARILEQTLQLMSSFEALIVVQFIHFVVPVIIGTFARPPRSTAEHADRRMLTACHLLL